MALFSFRQAELFFIGGAEAPPAPLGRTPVSAQRKEDLDQQSPNWVLKELTWTGAYIESS